MDQATGTLRFLVELWLEPRELIGAPRLVRGRVKDWERGEDTYVKSFAEIQAFIEDGLDLAGFPDRRWEGCP